MERTLRAISVLLNSRRLAVQLLSAMLLLLVLSALLPSPFTMTPRQWRELAERRPLIHRLSESLSTPRLVRGPVFVGLSAFLFLSTLVCTVSRLRTRLRGRGAEFDREQAFHCGESRRVPTAPAELARRAAEVLRKRRWRLERSAGRELVIVARRGSDVGFFGSIVFHAGLLVCFLAAPVTGLTLFRGEFVAAEGIPTPLRDGILRHEGRPPGELPDLTITLRNLEGEYEAGIYRKDFRGEIEVAGRRYPVAVNRPAVIEGYQFSLHGFGYAPRIVLRRGEDRRLDYFLNLPAGPEGDRFEVPGGPAFRVVLMPDFFREDGRIGTRSNSPRNPVLRVRLEGEGDGADGLVGLGREEVIGDWVVSFPELSRWADLVVLREGGVYVLAAGILVAVLGLLARFLSNERILEMRLRQERGVEGTELEIRGYGKYYPAFLEREVRSLAREIGRPGGRG